MLEPPPRRGQATGGVHSFVGVRFDLKRRAWTHPVDSTVPWFSRVCQVCEANPDETVP